MKGRDREAGFTLVEMLVALALFGVIAAMAVTMLRGSVDSQSRVQDRLAAMGGVQRLRAIMAEDLAQALPRWTRDERGTDAPPFLGGPDRMIFVQGGGSGWDTQAAPNVQRIEYRFVDGRWQRAVQPMLDGAVMPASGDVLAADVTRAVLRYRDAAGEWHEQWPAPNSIVGGDGDKSAQMPRAAELWLEQAGAPPLTMLFLVGVQP